MFLPQNIQFLLNLDTVLAGKMILEQAFCVVIYTELYKTSLTCHLISTNVCNGNLFKTLIAIRKRGTILCFRPEHTKVKSQCVQLMWCHKSPYFCTSSYLAKRLLGLRLVTEQLAVVTVVMLLGPLYYCSVVRLATSPCKVY